MNFNDHSDLAGAHAFLSPSQSQWLRYDTEKLKRVFFNRQQAARGSALHDLAHKLIQLGVKLPKTGQTLNMYVNDALGFHMKPEVLLMYSFYAFGTTDAIWYGPNYHVDADRMLLRVHDLKTGEGKTKFEQLYVYCALFCLEYLKDPFDIDFECRIYQNDERLIDIPEPELIREIMDTIVAADAVLNEARLEA